MLATFADVFHVKLLLQKQSGPEPLSWEYTLRGNDGSLIAGTIEVDPPHHRRHADQYQYIADDVGRRLS